MRDISTLSSFQVHIIPSIQNLAPDDPLRLTIAEVISKENEKLMHLYSDFGAGTSSSTTLPSEKPVQEQTDSTASQEANKIYLTCDSCDFRCEDFNTWIEHTIGHELISLNPQTAIPLDIVNVPVVPVEPVFITPVLPTPAVNYGTLITVMPTPNLTTISEPFPTIDPALIHQTAVVPQPSETLVSPQGVITEELDMEKSCANLDSGELINVNGMFVRIERFDGDASELISKSTISFENATDKTGGNGPDNGAGCEPISSSTVSFENACGKTDDASQLISFENATDEIGGNKPDDGSVLIRERMITFENALCEESRVTNAGNNEESKNACKLIIGFENAVCAEDNEMSAGNKQLSEENDNESVTSDESNLTDEVNENIDDLVRLANEGSCVEIRPSDLLRLTQGADDLR